MMLLLYYCMRRLNKQLQTEGNKFLKKRCKEVLKLATVSCSICNHDFCSFEQPQTFLTSGVQKVPMLTLIKYP